jgi:tripartite-type tricarboxylate transporter receptor subunit TctC
MLKRLLAALLLSPCLVLAQSYPTKPVRIVVPFPPGGGTDVVARILGQKLTETWGQQAIIENKAGASGSVGSDLVAKSAPDGYTLLLQGTQHAINLSLYKKLPYDTLRDFVPVAHLAIAPFLLIVNSSVPASSVTELIAYIKTQPNGLDYGSSGPGGGAHLAGEIFKTMAGVPLRHIPYKGGSIALTDLLGGQIPMLFDPIPTSLKHATGGRIKVLAISSGERVAAAPTVPTVSESGLPGFDVVSWFGLYAPNGTPATIVNKLNTDVNRALALTDVQEKFKEMGFSTKLMNASEFDTHLRAEIVKFAKAIKDSGATIDE